jgi:hypothetical protein
MARIYEAAAQKISAASASQILSVITGSRRASILELGIFAVTAVAGEIGLGRATGTGATPTSVLVQAMDTADEAGTSNLTSYATGITAPSVFMRRVQLPATIGSGVIWTWAPGDFLVPASTTTVGAPVLWQISTAAVTYDVYVKVLE